MVGGAAAGGAVLEDPILATEAQDALKQLGRVLWAGGIGPDARETEQGILIRDAFSVGPQGRVAGRLGDKLEAESLGVREAQGAILAIDLHRLGPQPLLPEVEAHVAPQLPADSMD